MIINKSDNERINRKVSENGGAIMFGSYKEYDRAGTLIKESQYSEDSISTYRMILDTGVMSSTSEYIHIAPISTVRLYYESGNQRGEVFSYDGMTEEREYYDNDGNNLKRYEKSSISYPSEYEGLEIDLQGYGYAVEEKIEDRIILWDFCAEYYENGRLKSIGKYSNRAFTLYRDRNSYLISKELEGSEESLNEHGSLSLIISKRPRIKDGRWLYFTEGGSLIAEEDYEEGVIK